MTDTNLRPLALVAELTHRCPLHCVYCSNPVELAARSTELSTEVWTRVFREAAGLGVLQADFTGGEPLARTDIIDLVRAARSTSLYVSLITSGLPLDESKLAALVVGGLDHFQLSFQGAHEPIAEEISGTRTHAQKLRVLEWVKQHRIGLTLNFVIHRQNIDELPDMIALVEQIQPGTAEFASVQYYGYGLANRANLMPTREQLEGCVALIKSAEERLKGKTRVVFVVPDYYARYPKPCVGGWGRKLMLVSPDGMALPCHAALTLPGMKFDSVKDKSLAEIWHNSEAFQKFRGTGWMQEPCRTCDRREVDFGGCRCQTLALAGDAAATDPVCSLSPLRPRIDQILTEVPSASRNPSEKLLWIYRPNPA